MRNAKYPLEILLALTCVRFLDFKCVLGVYSCSAGGRGKHKGGSHDTTAKTT